MPESKTAPPTTALSEQATAPLETPEARVARLNQQLGDRGDWTQSQRQRIDPAQIELLTNTVAKGCTLHDLNLLLEIGGRYGLSPFLGQIFAAKFDGEEGPVTIFTGRDGMLQAARNTGKLVRVVSAVVREHDVFQMETVLGGSDDEGVTLGSDTKHVEVQLDPVTRLVHMREGMGSVKRGAITGAYALIWRVGDPFPHYAEASWEEYGETRQLDLNGEPTTWHLNHRNGFPEAMMRKVPESTGLKIAFGITGIQSAEELGDRPGRVQNLSNPGGAAGALKNEPITVEYGDDDLGRELFELVKAVNELRPRQWSPIKVAMQINGHPSERAKLRDRLRRTLGSLGDRGKTALEGIPHTKVEEPAPAQPVPSATPAAAESTNGSEATTGTPAAPLKRLADLAQPADTQTTLEGQIAEAEAEPEPYKRNAHVNLARRVKRMRARIAKLDADPPTLEREEALATALHTLDGMLVELEQLNVAAEAAGKTRKDA